MLEALLPKQGSLLTDEKRLLSSNVQFPSITYHPLTKWTDQPTTSELLDKKFNLRQQFTSNIDFPNYKQALFANAEAKLERLDKLKT